MRGLWRVESPRVRSPKSWPSCATDGTDTAVWWKEAEELRHKVGRQNVGPGRGWMHFQMSAVHASLNVVIVIVPLHRSIVVYRTKVVLSE